MMKESNGKRKAFLAALALFSSGALLYNHHYCVVYST